MSLNQRKTELIGLSYNSVVLVTCKQTAGLTSGGAVVIEAATLLPGHTDSILKDHVPGTAACLVAPGGVEALCVTVEVRAEARTGLPTRPFLLASTTV